MRCGADATPFASTQARPSESFAGRKLQLPPERESARRVSAEARCVEGRESGWTDSRVRRTWHQAGGEHGAAGRARVAAAVPWFRSLGALAALQPHGADGRDDRRLHD